MGWVISSASCNSASGRPRPRGISFDYTTNRHEITVYYTMAWLPASLLKHTGAYRHAQQQCAMKGDVMEQW